MRRMIVVVSVSILLAGCSREPSPGSPAPSQPSSSDARAVNIQTYQAVPESDYKPVIGKRGGTLMLATFGQGPKSFNPVTAGETTTTVYTSRIFEGLTDLNAWTYQAQPLLAESWSHDESGLIWTVKLRKNVTWNDGKPFTADDVVFTYMDVIYNPKITCSTRDIITVGGKQWKVEKVNEHTVKFTLPSRFAIFDKVIATEIIPKHKYGASVNEGTFDSAMGLESKTEDIVGTGAFMFDRYETGVSVTLKRNPAYWRKDAQGNPFPYLDAITWQIVQNYDAMMLKFKQGETDLYDLRGQDYPILKPLEKEGKFKIYAQGPNFGSSFVVFNQNPGKSPETGKSYVEPFKLAWFSRTEFRQAVAHAIDKRGIIDTVLNGLGYPQNGPMTFRAGYFYNDKIKDYDYDPRKAKALLAKIGLVDRNGDGFLEDGAGNKVEFTLLTNAGNTIREKISEIVRKDLERVGMKANLLWIEFNTLVTKLDKTFDWEAVLLGLTGGPEPHWGANVWKSSGRMHMWYPYQKEPATPWEARIDEIFVRGIEELDPAKRKALYDEWQMIINEQQPYVYTVAAEDLAAVRDRLGNIFVAPIGGALFNMHEIFVR
ncbi:MAG: ABC transporter substrate-binding protein [Phycisphaerae bacterium]|nr:ABC transporter substrate-binding protein [Phycisphaerae bacterium]